MADPESLARIARALDLAIRAHEGQRRRDGRREPFVNHIADVARRVAESQALDETTLIAALLHDVAEKTGHGLPEIERSFGREVAAVVAELTDDQSLPKRQRHRMQVEHASAMSEPAKRVKLADKASKLASIADSPPQWWGRAKARRELAWAREVVAVARGTDRALEASFDGEAARADKALGG